MARLQYIVMSRFERQPFIIAVDDAIESKATISNLCGFIPYNLSSLTKVIEYRSIWEIDIQTSIYVVDCPTLIS